MSKFQDNNRKIAQEKRLKDFEARKCDEIRNHFKTNSFDSEFVTVHPMADEYWWFDKFNKNPDICKILDLYWKFDNDVAFVQIWSGDVSNIELYARWKNRKLYLSAKVQDNLISSETIEIVLNTFWKEHLKENLFRRFYLKRKPHQIK